MTGHPSLTEPVLAAHLLEEHGWRRLDIYRRTYFQRLVAHARAHRKAVSS